MHYLISIYRNEETTDGDTLQREILILNLKVTLASYQYNLQFTPIIYLPYLLERKQNDSYISDSVEKIKNFSKVSESLDSFSKENHQSWVKNSLVDDRMKELPIFNISTHKLWKRKRLLTRKCWKKSI